MTRGRTEVRVGMEVLDAAAAAVGHVQEIADGVLRIRLHRDIYVPREVVHPVSAERIALDLRTDRLAQVCKEHVAEPVPSGLRQMCSACDTVIVSDPAQPILRKGDARFCMGCWSHLSAHEVERVVQEVALRGVPLS